MREMLRLRRSAERLMLKEELRRHFRCFHDAYES